MGTKAFGEIAPAAPAPRRSATTPDGCTGDMDADGVVDSDEDCINHGGDANACPCDAVSEGWAEYFPVAVYDDINPADHSWGWSGASGEIDLEPNDGADNPNDDGEKNEWAFASALWDIKDDAEDPGDKLALGEDEIWATFFVGHPHTTLDFFMDFTAFYPECRSALSAIYLAHGMEPVGLRYFESGAKGKLVKNWRYKLQGNENRRLLGSSPAIAPNQESVPMFASWLGVNLKTLAIFSGSDEGQNFYPEYGGQAAPGMWRVFNGHPLAADRVRLALDTESGPAMSSPNPADINGDGKIFPEFVGGTAGWNLESVFKNNDQLLGFSLGTADAAWTFPSPPQEGLIGGAPRYEFVSSPAMADVVQGVNLEGPEVIIGNTSSQLSAAKGGLWMFDGDNSDGVDDGISGIRGQPVGPDTGWYAPAGVEGVDWDLIDYFSTTGTVANVDTGIGPVPLKAVYSTPAVDDLDNDGQPEIVFGGINGYVYAVDPVDMVKKWELKTGGPIFGSAAIADFDGDSDKEVVIGSTDGYVYFINEDVDGNGKINLFTEATSTKSTFTPSQLRPVYSSPAIAKTPVWNASLGKLQATNELSVYVTAGGPDPRTAYPNPLDPAEGRSEGKGALNKFTYDVAANEATRDWHFDRLGATSTTVAPVISSPALGTPAAILGEGEWSVPWPMFRQNSARTGFYDRPGSQAADPLYVYFGDDDGLLYRVHGTFGPGISAGNEDRNDAYRVGGAIRSSPAVGDIDGDGRLEIVFYDWGFAGKNNPTTPRSRFWSIEDIGDGVPPPLTIVKPGDMAVDVITKDGAAALHVDAGSVAFDATDETPTIEYGLQATVQPGPAPGGLVSGSSTFEVLPDGLAFKPDKPAMLTIRYDAKVKGDNADIFGFDPQKKTWEKITLGRTVDKGAKKLSVKIKHFSVYAVFGPTPATGVNTAALAALGLSLLLAGSGLIFRELKRAIFPSCANGPDPIFKSLIFMPLGSSSDLPNAQYVQRSLPANGRGGDRLERLDMRGHFICH